MKNIMKVLPELFDILDNSGLSEKEIKYRKKRFIELEKKITESDDMANYNIFHQQAHEIRSFQLLKQMGSVKVAEDHKSTEGCDIIFNDNIYIECICASPDEMLENEIKTRCDNVIRDYKGELINTRFTNSISVKLKFYNEKLGKSIIPKNKPYVIFLGTGMLSNIWFALDNGIAFTDILFGRGIQQIAINPDNGQLISSEYTHNENIEKHNGAKIDCNIFLNKEYECISAILLPRKSLDKYTCKNTYLYINPYAKNKVKAKDFWGLTYWKADKDNYTPRYKGRTLKNKRAKPL